MTDPTVPTVHDLVSELRRTVGLFDGAMSCTTAEAWEQALVRVLAERQLLADLLATDALPTDHAKQEAARLLRDENETGASELRLRGLGHHVAAGESR